ncbi:glycosyltransferase family protein [Postechiella marina]|uniref:Glycosyltransferase family protein n=1 Tax=Postechiella marina TaxID=943941 RepID=A0ABP8CA28_9FLAO
MKVLYAIQGTGNGHLSRARDIIPLLNKQNIELDILVSGTQADIDIPHPIKYQLKGLSFIFGKKGGVNMWKTYIRANTRRLQKEINSLPIEKYDIIINDFEPVSAWACKLKNKACISLSHQAAVMVPNAPKPKKKDPLGKLILKKYAPTTKQYGFHFKSYQDNIFTPVIRQDIRNITCTTGDYYTVYLPSYGDDKILKTLSKIKNTKWQVFSKHNKTAIKEKNIIINPISNEAFVTSMANSKGILCGAGFETPAEALFMKKKLMVIPMKGQYEQQCNAAALKDMGVPVIKSLKKKHLNKLKNWVESDKIINVDYPDLTEKIVNQLLKESIA